MICIDGLEKDFSFDLSMTMIYDGNTTWGFFLSVIMKGWWKKINKRSKESLKDRNVMRIYSKDTSKGKIFMSGFSSCLGIAINHNNNFKGRWEVKCLQTLMNITSWNILDLKLQRKSEFYHRRRRVTYEDVLCRINLMYYNKFSSD